MSPVFPIVTVSNFQLPLNAMLSMYSMGVFETCITWKETRPFQKELY